MEEALKETKQLLESRLEKIVSPDKKIEELRLTDLIDVKGFRRSMVHSAKHLM